MALNSRPAISPCCRQHSPQEKRAKAIHISPSNVYNQILIIKKLQSLKPKTSVFFEIVHQTSILREQFWSFK